MVTKKTKKTPKKTSGEAIVVEEKKALDEETQELPPKEEFIYDDVVADSEDNDWFCRTVCENINAPKTFKNMFVGVLREELGVYDQEQDLNAYDHLYQRLYMQTVEKYAKDFVNRETMQDDEALLEAELKAYDNATYYLNAFQVFNRLFRQEKTIANFIMENK